MQGSLLAQSSTSLHALPPSPHMQRLARQVTEEGGFSGERTGRGPLLASPGRGGGVWGSPSAAASCQSSVTGSRAAASPGWRRVSLSPDGTFAGQSMLHGPPAPVATAADELAAATAEYEALTARLLVDVAAHDAAEAASGRQGVPLTYKGRPLLDWLVREHR